MWDLTKYFVKLLSRHIKHHVSIADALELHLFLIKPSLYHDCINYTNVIGFCALLNVDWGDPHHMIATAIPYQSYNSVYAYVVQCGILPNTLWNC